MDDLLFLSLLLPTLPHSHFPPNGHYDCFFPPFFFFLKLYIAKNNTKTLNPRLHVNSIYTSHPMMSETTTFVCVDRGRPVAEAFSANGFPTATLKDVKSAIKAEKAAKLDDISADKFTLCKVSGNVSNAAVDEIAPFENKNGSNEVPKSTAEFSGLLDTGSRKAIHVVVERSPCKDPQSF